MSSDPNKPENLVSVATEVEASAIVTALAGLGITASTTGGHTAGFRAEAPGWVQVWVRHKDWEQAKAALATIERDAAEIDWSQVDVGRPER
ncbi:MAG: hypothetical protein KDA45_11820 [Planctomycetales bacterium]|nr:hypothetical protein [Planctomycetales bacterium]